MRLQMWAGGARCGRLAAKQGTVLKAAPPTTVSPRWTGHRRAPSALAPASFIFRAVQGASGRTEPRRRGLACNAYGRSSDVLAQPSGLRGLYPAPQLLQSGHINVSGGHAVYIEVLGNPNGIPALFVHGGPGAGCYSNHARFFDPKHYKIILMDQRGCGRSTPRGCLADNTTSALVEDIETLRQHLGISQLLLLGGSWGVALSLAYAQAYPQAVLGLVLRGVCLMRLEEIMWMYCGGAAALKPLAYEQFVGHLPQHERSAPLLGYYKRLMSPDAAVRDAAAQAWMRWEMAVCQSNPSDMYVWDGKSWTSQHLEQQPAARELLPPVLAGGAAQQPASKGGQAWPALPRGAVLPAEVLSGMTTTQSTDPPRSRGCDRRAQQSASVSDTVSPKLTAPLQLPGVAASDSTQAWVPGLPLLGANLSDPAVQRLLWKGLNYPGDPALSSAQALLECHYSIHGAFLLEAPLLAHMERIQHIPAIAVQGQLDFVCPPSTAVALHQALPSMELRLVPGAGHSMYDPAITDQLVRATDRMRALRPLSPVAA